MCHDCGMYRSSDLHGTIFVPEGEDKEVRVCWGCLWKRGDEERRARPAREMIP